MNIQQQKQKSAFHFMIWNPNFIVDGVRDKILNIELEPF